MRCDHPRSDCRADADCPGGRCAELPADPGAPCVCIGPRPEPTRGFCDGAQPDGCCQDADCGPAQLCQQEVYGPQNEYCGGARPPETNTCRGDQCTDDTTCGPGEVCIPAGAFGYVFGLCRPITCRTDADCAAAPGGECRPFFRRCSSATFACTYAADPCRTDADCPEGPFGRQFCAPRIGGGTVCQDDIPVP